MSSHSHPTTPRRVRTRGGERELNESTNEVLTRNEAMNLVARLGTTVVEVPEWKKSIAKGAFNDASIETLLLGSRLMGAAFEGATIGTLRVRSGVCAIPDEAFYESRIGELRLPDSVKSIGERAFKGAHIGTLVVGNGVETIGDHAFCEASIGELKLPDSVKSFGQKAFASASIEIMHFGKGVEDIRGSSFQSARIGELRLSGVVRILTKAFNKATIRALHMGNDLTFIGSRAFHSAHIIGGVDLPDSVRQIGNDAFSGAKMKFLRLGSGVTTINRRAFFQSVIESRRVVVPNSVTSLGKDVFCKAILKCSDVFIGTGIETIDEGAFCDAHIPRGVKASSSLKHIGKYAFKGVTNCRFLELGGEVETVGDGAFFMARISGPVVLSTAGSLKKIGQDAFSSAEIPQLTACLSDAALIQTDMLRWAMLPSKVNHAVELAVHDMEIRRRECIIKGTALAALAAVGNDPESFTFGWKYCVDELALRIADLAAFIEPDSEIMEAQAEVVKRVQYGLVDCAVEKQEGKDEEGPPRKKVKFCRWP